MLVVGWPLNSYLMKRGVRIQKGTSTARDKRMAVINELVGAVSPDYECLSFSVLNHQLLDKIHQILRLGGSVDPTSP